MYNFFEYFLKYAKNGVFVDHNMVLYYMLTY